MLPVDAVVLFMNADDIRRFLAFPIRANDDAVEVFDYAETVAAKLKIVGTVTKTAVAKVEGLFAVEGRARVGVGYRLVVLVSNLSI